MEESFSGIRTRSETGRKGIGGFHAKFDAHPTSRLQSLQVAEVVHSNSSRVHWHRIVDEKGGYRERKSELNRMASFAPLSALQSLGWPTLQCVSTLATRSGQISQKISPNDERGFSESLAVALLFPSPGKRDHHFVRLLTSKGCLADRMHPNIGMKYSTKGRNTRRRQG